jgi:hypothetical protein
MVAILTGDIVSSRRMPDKRKWLKRLKEIIERKSGLAKAPKWDVFRGDGFQVELSSPADALRIAFLIRCGLKSIPELFSQGIDARIGIGIGEKEYSGKSISDSDGQAYQWSGGVLDSLKGEQKSLQMKSPWPEVDQPMNIALQLAGVIIDEWTNPEAEIAWLWLTENKTQVEMARKLKITQPAVHKRMAGAHLRELSNLLAYFHEAIRNRSENISK